MAYNTKCLNKKLNILLFHRKYCQISILHPHLYRRHLSKRYQISIMNEVCFKLQLKDNLTSIFFQVKNGFEDYRTHYSHSDVVWDSTYNQHRVLSITWWRVQYLTCDGKTKCFFQYSLFQKIFTCTSMSFDLEIINVYISLIFTHATSNFSSHFMT